MTQLVKTYVEVNVAVSWEWDVDTVELLSVMTLDNPQESAELLGTLSRGQVDSLKQECLDQWHKTHLAVMPFGNS